MDLTSYAGVMAGADSLSHSDDPELLFEAGKWSESGLRKRLRNNHMPSDFPFLLDESNRNGPCVDWDGAKYTVVKSSAGKLTYTDCEQTAVGLIGKWVDQSEGQLN